MVWKGREGEKRGNDLYIHDNWSPESRGSFIKQRRHKQTKAAEEAEDAVARTAIGASLSLVAGRGEGQAGGAGRDCEAGRGAGWVSEGGWVVGCREAYAIERQS